MVTVRQAHEGPVVPEELPGAPWCPLASLAPLSPGWALTVAVRALRVDGLRWDGCLPAPGLAALWGVGAVR